MDKLERSGGAGGSLAFKLMLCFDTCVAYWSVWRVCGGVLVNSKNCFDWGHLEVPEALVPELLDLHGDACSGSGFDVVEEVWHIGSIQRSLAYQGSPGDLVASVWR